MSVKKRIKKIYVFKLVATHLLGMFVSLLWPRPAIAQEINWTLDRCIEIGTQNNTALQIQRNKIAMSETAIEAAKFQLIPKLNAQADYKYFYQLPYQLMPLNSLNPMATEGEFKEIQFGVPHNISANLQLAMPLFNTSIRGKIETTEMAKEMEETKLSQTIEQTVVEITTIYYNIKILKNQLSFIDSNLTNIKMLVSNSKLLQAHSLLRQIDKEKLKLEANRLQLHKEQVEIQIAHSTDLLKIKMGVSTNEQINITKEIEFKEYQAYPIVENNAIKLQMIQKKMSANDLKILKNSIKYPEVNLIAAYSTNGFGYNGTPSSFLDFYPSGFAGVKMSYSINGIREVQHKSEQKKLEIRNSELLIESLENQTNENIEYALNTMNHSIKRIELQLQQIEVNKKLYEHTTLQLLQGVSNLAEIISADNNLRQAQQDYLKQVSEYLMADLELRKFTGNIITK